MTPEDAAGAARKWHGVRLALAGVLDPYSRDVVGPYRDGGFDLGPQAAGRVPEAYRTDPGVRPQAVTAMLRGMLGGEQFHRAALHDGRLFELDGGEVRSLRNEIAQARAERDPLAQRVTRFPGDDEPTVNVHRSEDPGDAAPPQGPQLTVDDARAAAEARGLDTSQLDLTYQPRSDPYWIPDTYGFTRFTFGGEPYVNSAGRHEVTLTDLGLRSERDAVYTLAHEAGHIVLRTTDHELAEAYAEDLLRGQEW